MSGDSELFITTGHIQQETHKIVWKIEDWLVHQQCQIALQEQKIEFVVGNTDDTRSKWLVGFTLTHDNNRILYYVKLLEIFSGKSSLKANVSIHFLQEDKKSVACSKWFDQKECFEINDQVTEVWLEAKPQLKHWGKLLDSNGAITMRVTMRLTKTKTQNSCDLSAVAMADFSEASLFRLKYTQTELLRDSESADVKIVCSDGKIFHAHRLILSARCSVFEKMLRSQDISEGRPGIINVDDVSGKTMGISLHYIYTGDLQAGWKDADTIGEFTYAAGKFRLTDILEMLDKLLGKSDDTVCNVMLLGLAGSWDYRMLNLN